MGLLRFAILDYSVGIAFGLFYAPPKNLGGFLFDILFQLVGGAAGIVPLAVVSAALWSIGETRGHSPRRVGLAVGLGSLIFMLFWVNFVLGSNPAQLQPSQVLAVSLSICNGAYAAWKTSRSERTARAQQLPVAQPSGQPVPSLDAAVPAPAGVIPGSPIISLLNASSTQIVSAATTIPLKPRPTSATHVRVTITPTKAGSLSFGTDPAGNNPSGSWTVDDVVGGHGATWYDFPLNDSVATLYLTPAGGFAGAVTIEYLNYVPTLVGVNARGQTYGVSGSGHRGEPDLVAVEATNGKDGYAIAVDLQGGPMPTSPADAIARQEANQGRSHPIPVYKSDGTTIIGEFTIG